jgi:hypothetical protein
MHQSRCAIIVHSVHVRTCAKQFLNLHVIAVPDRDQQVGGTSSKQHSVPHEQENQQNQTTHCGSPIIPYPKFVLQRPPFSAYTDWIDFNGGDTTGDLLPGTTVNASNRGMGRAELERLVRSSTQPRLALRMHKRSILRLTLPARYAFGDNFHELDLRLSRSFVLGERWRLSLIGDVIDQFHASRGFVLELMVVVILVIELAYLFRGKI